MCFLYTSYMYIIYYTYILTILKKKYELFQLDWIETTADYRSVTIRRFNSLVF